MSKQLKIKSRTILSISVFCFSALILSFVQMKVERPMILLERFVEGGGWIEIFFIASYGAVIAWHMHDKSKTAKWRKNTWLFFSIVFFSQLLIGLLGNEKFLMTGQLHLPIPMMIIGGPVYRLELSFMTILFLSTVILTGPAWCSHFCYFGAFDGYASFRKNRAKPLKNLNKVKFPILFTVIASAILLRSFNVPVLYATLLAGIFGVIGLGIIIFYTPKKGKMLHCTAYCPVGTVINYLRFANPFRLVINNSCDSCLKCTIACKYSALDKNTIANKKPGITCTLCGDCLDSCHSNAFEYKIFGIRGEKARNIYLFLTISIHVVFLALARI